MSVPLAHHFDDPQQQFDAANLGMWLFLATELLFFGGLFAGYAQYRYFYPDAFAIGSQHLNLLLGTANTTVLLASSLTMALAVHSAQTSDQKALVRFLLATIVLGVVFLAVKAYEYWHKFHEHLVPGSSFAIEGNLAPASSGQVELFFSFYFAMTGLHALHMVIGIVALAILARGAIHGRFAADYFTPIEMVGLYWHFVDIVWVFLFPLLYLIG